MLIAQQSGVFDTPRQRESVGARWFSGLYFLTGVVGYAAGLHIISEALLNRTAKWEVTGRILAFPIIGVALVSLNLVLMYFAATATEIARRLVLPQVAMHNEWLYLPTLIIGGFLVWAVAKLIEFVID